MRESSCKRYHHLDLPDILGGLGAAKVASASKVKPPTGAVKDVPGAGLRNLYHYTDEAGLNGILNEGKLNPSLKALRPSDVKYGNGQYFTDIPPGTMEPKKLSGALVRNPHQTDKFTLYLEINPDGLNVVEGRSGVYVVPNEVPSGGGPSGSQGGGIGPPTRLWIKAQPKLLPLAATLRLITTSPKRPHRPSMSVSPANARTAFSSSPGSRLTPLLHSLGVNAGMYHTHTRGLDPESNEGYSLGDKDKSDGEGAPSYLGTPRGMIYKYSPIPNHPSQGDVSVLGNTSGSSKKSPPQP
jgi:HYD1 signature containing ADP-ribosyltransferase